jgi:hypothetical protein
MNKAIVCAAIAAASLVVTSRVSAADLIVAPPLGPNLGGHEIFAHNEMGQSFVAPASSTKVGFLVTYDAASAALGAPNATTSTIFVRIYQGEGLAFANFLGQAAVNVDTTQVGFVDFDLSTAGIVLVPGSTYTLGMMNFNRGWINPSACVLVAGGQPVGMYDFGHPFLVGTMITDETGICDNAFHVLDLNPGTPTPTPTPTPSPTPSPTPTPTPSPSPTPSPTPTPTPSPNDSPIVSTGKSVEGEGKVSNANDGSITVNGILVRYNIFTKIKLSYGKPLAVGQKVGYKGMLNTDKSVSTSYIEVK